MFLEEAQVLDELQRLVQGQQESRQLRKLIFADELLHKHDALFKPLYFIAHVLTLGNPALYLEQLCQLVTCLCITFAANGDQGRPDFFDMIPELDTLLLRYLRLRQYCGSTCIQLLRALAGLQVELESELVEIAQRHVHFLRCRVSALAAS